MTSSDLTMTHKEPVYCVKFNKSFKHVVTASEGSVSDPSLLYIGSTKSVLKVQKTQIHCNVFLTFTHNYFKCLFKVIKIWDIETGNQVFEFSEAHGSSGVTCIAFDSSERR